jgi:hypothetical protein
MSARRWPLAFVALSALGCNGESLTRGLTEPIRIDGAQFIEGELPGIPADSAAAKAESVAKLPSLVSFSSLTIVPPGAVDRGVSGTATRGTVSVGVRFTDLGDGYWVLPTTTADLFTENELAWGGLASYARQPKAGRHELLAVAIDEKGRAGVQSSLDVCLLPEVPDNGNVCDPSKDPPKLVVSLGWNSPVDLDLRVVTPDGKIVDAKHPSTALAGEDGKVDPTAEGTGQILSDSNASCQLDGQQRESLVFQARPAPGKYLVYANLFEACDQASVEFTMTVHSSVPIDDHFGQLETLRKSGGLQAIHANAGASLGTFLTQFTIE